ncbi:TonB-dependent receptor [Microbulbifer aggregans]|uniref:TonB-dependent receptor n=1 Tax=Microbulbifer aggregans TaxID=1769779 RepID=UPI001CFF16CE|nr:TonB-dependent receptor [Microbulbifer aggregans]
MSVRLKAAIQSANKMALRYGSISALALAGITVPGYAQEAALEEIQVTGIRGSLRSALDSKRDADSVIDSVSAEDIGKFPDKNIGDALQRVPGVTVVRGFGEVNGVTVRGTAPQHSVVLLNGQNVASVGWFDLGGTNRSFNFELLSAEQIAGMDVYKSVDPSLNEGALGGTVNLRTRKPLEMDEFTATASVENGYSEAGEDWMPAYSGLVSWKNADSTFGVLLAHSSEQQRVIRETLSSFAPPYDHVPDSNGATHNMTWGMASILFDEERERESSQLTVQFSPSDALTFSLDYNLFSLDNEHINTALFAIPDFNGAYLDADSVVTNAQGAVTSATVVPGNLAEGGVPFFNNSVLRKPQMETDALNLAMDYEGQGWRSHVVIGRSEADSFTPQTSTWWGDLNDRASTGFSFDLTDAHEIIPTDPTYVTDHSRFQLFQEFTFLDNIRQNEIEYFQADFSVDMNKGIFTTVDTGLKLQDQTYLGRVDNRDVDLAAAMADGLTLADFNGGVVSGLHDQEGRSGSLGSFAVINGGIWDYGYANRADTITVTSDFSITEEITAAYAKANFEGNGFRGNVGLRLVDTTVLSSGRIDGEPAKGERDYTNLLPSINLVADITEDLLFRFAAGSTVSRPDYDDMQMASTIVVNIAEATVGSPDLDPYKSDNYDMGVEWYFTDASVVGATLFHKNISDYIEQTTALEPLEGCSQTCRVTRARNVGTADITGIELQYQHDLGNGFGVQANYTYTDSSVTNSAGQEVAVDEVSRNSYNLSGYYENDLISARVAYNARDGWHSNYNSSGADSEYDNYDQVDASLIWHALDNLDVSFEAVNIFNEPLVQRLPNYGIIHSVDEFGARYYVGASMKF